MSAAVSLDTSPTIPCPPPDAPLPPVIVRQFVGQPSWKKRLVHRVWHERAAAYDIVDSGGIAFMPCEPVKIARRKIVSLLDHADAANLPESIFAVLTALYDRLVEAQNTIPVVALDHRARHGLIVIRLPLPSALAGAA